MRISHVSCGVEDLDEVERRLREELGLGLWRFPESLGAHIPLAQHQYIELYTQAHPLWRPGWIAWSVAVPSLDPFITSLGLDDTRQFGHDPTKTFTPWRGRHAATARSRASGGVLPYLIEYDESVDLAAVFEEKHRVALHAVAVGAIGSVTTDGKRITSVAVDVDGRREALPLP